MDPDVLVKILRRLPPNSRRRSRLVCRRWRDLVDKRTTTDLLSRAKTFLFAAGHTGLILGDKIRQRPRKVLAIAEDRTISIIGTCNGLICLCDDSRPPGAIALANLATGERLALPPLPGADIIARFTEDWHAAYGFAHHQATGRYKVVHLPCCFDRVYEFDTLQVFTLGEAAWRDVPTPPTSGGAGPRCRFDIGVVSVDGATYWVTKGTGKIMSFDLEDEKITSVHPMPVEAIQVLKAKPCRFRRRLRCTGGWAWPSSTVCRQWTRQTYGYWGVRGAIRHGHSGTPWSLTM
ncbi:hypothetical protein ACQ4PT_022467 [Festuca glaucescens]